METIERDNLLENVKAMSEHFRRRIEKQMGKLSIIKELRIRGMMIGIELKTSGVPAVAECMKRGVLINCTHETVIRLLPALNISEAQVDEGLDVLGEVLSCMEKGG